MFLLIRGLSVCVSWLLCLTFELMFFFRWHRRIGVVSYTTRISSYTAKRAERLINTFTRYRFYGRTRQS